MSDITTALETLAERGAPRGAEWLMDALEDEISHVGRVRLRPVSPAGGLTWRSGIAIAAAAFVLVLLVGLALGALDLRSDDSAPEEEVTDVPDEETSSFDGLIVADEGRVFAVDGPVHDPELLVDVECCVSAFYADGAGGVVYQREDTVAWARGDGPARNIAASSPGQTLSLEGVGVFDGELAALLLVTQSEAAPQQVIAVGLESGTEREVRSDFGPGVVVDRVSLAQDRLLYSVRDARGGWFELRDLATGAPLASVAVPHARPDGTWVGQGVLAPDGSAMVYEERQPEDRDGGLADFVVVDLATSEETARWPLANLGDRIVSFDGSRAVILRQRADPSQAPVTMAIDVRTGEMYVELTR